MFMHEFGMPIARIIMIAAASGLGFALGWLISPQSANFRRVALLILAGLLVAAAIFLNNIIGWNAAFLLAIVGFVAGLSYWLSNLMSGFFEMPDTFGSSRWARPDDLTEKNIYGSEGILLGRALDKEGASAAISYKGDRHLLTVAPTRSGKGTTQIVPNLLTYEGSTLVIDPKGENALITAKRRQAMGHEVHVVDPWGIAPIEGIETSSFNPLDWLDFKDMDITENAMILADALVMDEDHSDSFWGEEAKALLQGLLLHVATDTGEDGKRHLGRVRELLLETGEAQTKLFNRMAQSMHPVVASTGLRSLQKDQKLLSNVLASAQAQTHFLDSDRLRQNLANSSFRFEDLKSKPMTVYLVLPADRLNTFGRWLRLLIQQAVTVNARNIDTKPEKAVLFILDEFAALGRLNMVEQAYGLMAGFGMQLWAIVQDFNQLEKTYGDGWQSFVANAGMINYFGSSDFKTAEYFSHLCGEKTVWSLSSAIAHTFSSGAGGASNSTTSTDTQSTAQRKLAYPDELMRMREDKQVAFIENMYPMIANKVRWFENPDLKDLGVDLHTAE